MTDLSCGGFYKGYEKKLKSKKSLKDDFALKNNFKTISFLVFGNIIFSLLYYFFEHIEIFIPNIVIIVIHYFYQRAYIEKEELLKKMYRNVGKLDFAGVIEYMKEVNGTEYKDNENYYRFQALATCKLVDSNKESEHDLFENCDATFDHDTLFNATNSESVFKYFILKKAYVTFMDKMLAFTIDKKIIENAFIKIIENYIKADAFDNAFKYIVELNPTEKMLSMLEYSVKSNYAQECAYGGEYMEKIVELITSKYFNKYPVKSIKILNIIFKNSNKYGLDTIILKELDLSKMSNKSIKGIPLEYFSLLEMEKKDYNKRVFVRDNLVMHVLECLYVLQSKETKDAILDDLFKELDILKEIEMQFILDEKSKINLYHLDFIKKILALGDKAKDYKYKYFMLKQITFIVNKIKLDEECTEELKLILSEMKDNNPFFNGNVEKLLTLLKSK